MNNSQVHQPGKIVKRDRFIAKVRNAIKSGGNYSYDTINERFLEVLGYRVSYYKLSRYKITFKDGFAQTE